jgi:peptidyl-prolyl cis-trans isomerase B (cyclophilin B)
MKIYLATSLVAFCLFYVPQASAQKKADESSATPQKEKIKKEKPVTVIMEIIMNNKTLDAIEIELDREKAPITVTNFLNYVERKFYDNLVFHRVINDFMIQGGGFDENLSLKPTDASIKNEANNGLKNDKGTIAMARTPDPNSASSQFYINLKNNDFLNYRGMLPSEFGYAVFGKVTKGMDVVEKIGLTPTTSQQSMRDVPATPVIIKSIRLKDGKK